MNNVKIKYRIRSGINTNTLFILAVVYVYVKFFNWVWEE